VEKRAKDGNVLVIFAMTLFNHFLRKFLQSNFTEEKIQIIQLRLIFIIFFTFFFMMFPLYGYVGLKK